MAAKPFGGRWKALALAALFVAAPVAAGATPSAAEVVHRIAAPEAGQGVASDGTYVYAVDNHAIGRYRISDGHKVAEWRGDAAQFPHINSCTIAGRELVCAASNYPGVPQLSAIEFFDPETLHHLRSVSLGIMPGSLTGINRHAGQWWAVFANYDGGVRGGDPARDHRYTLFAQLNAQFHIARSWGFPDDVLERFSPRSASGASWGPDGHLYVSGHDLPELYVLDLPEAGPVLVHKGTAPISTHGQAIDFDPRHPGLLWSIDRESHTMVASRIGVKP